MIDIGMRFGKIASVTLAPTIREEHKGYGGTSKPRGTSCVVESSDESRVGNIAYWKEHYSNKWLQAHDNWKRKDDLWWEEHVYGKTQN